MKRISILFVCMGNICRSPLAEGIFSHLVDEAGLADRFEIDSAGTGGWHEGDHPDRRSIATAKGHGIDISQQRARQIRRKDFSEVDLMLAMDRANIADLRRMSPEAANIRLFGEDIPDPYFGSSDGFELVYAMLFAGCKNLLETLGTDNASWSGKISSVR
ncbi:protein-tyrosine phosphatase [Rhizobium mesoamericanum]|uniref:low molecular weight protein-tyrosine-phosphatase n=1 Tax=Rhizobium mesoamericanum TaxID=1079800 RepID=UPI00278BA1C4|nr:low molecular weight protein-tyrosine-phosphatase [Rhizobium mesoamericanum]MDQ0560788.1 protein-tyrosine phosphatase [Rhizobium mesoamericanum]